MARLLDHSFRQPVLIALGPKRQYPDERLIVKLKDGKSIEGDMIEASDTNLSLSRGKKVVNIPRSDIQSIWHAKGKASKTQWALIGAGLGAGVGGGVQS